MIIKKFKKLLKLDLKNKTYFFVGRITGLDYTSIIKEIGFLDDDDIYECIIIDLQNNVSVILNNNCEIEFEEKSNKIYCYNSEGICLGYIREI